MMNYGRGKDDNSLLESIRPVVEGLGLDLIEATVSRHRGSVQIRVVVYRGAALTAGISASFPARPKEKPRPVGIDDCSRVHHAVLPRLELAFPGQELYLEVSSPGIDRLIRDGSEFAHYRGRGIRCYRTDISDWSSGILLSSDEEGIVLRNREGELSIPYSLIAKAKLDYSLE
ncbi:MAG: ribosome assembly cofactor RimP [Treponema sp.]|jgi:ribosome maturation factor RimP|nr:ribosome assembly cofactor RimP [Treponema sp.]